MLCSSMLYQAMATVVQSYSLCSDRPLTFIFRTSHVLLVQVERYNFTRRAIIPLYRTSPPDLILEATNVLRHYSTETMSQLWLLLAPANEFLTLD